MFLYWKTYTEFFFQKSFTVVVVCDELSYTPHCASQKSVFSMCFTVESREAVTLFLIVCECPLWFGHTLIMYVKVMISRLKALSCLVSPSFPLSFLHSLSLSLSRPPPVCLCTGQRKNRVESQAENRRVVGQR